MSLYFGMVKCIDDNVGRILTALRTEGLLEKTLIVFTADHGDMCGEHGRYDKEIPLEASARIPFVIYYPARIRPGTVVHEALATVDFKPTILPLMGLPNDATDEGRDASALFINGKAPLDWVNMSISRDAGGKWLMAANSRYKFILSADSDPCLFDLDQDPFELHNRLRSPSARETVRELARALVDYNRKFNDPIAAKSGIREDISWAASYTDAYVPPPREAIKSTNLPVQN